MVSSYSSDDSDNQNQINNDLIIVKLNVTSIDGLTDEDCELESYLEFFEDGTFLEQSVGGTFGGPCSPDAPNTGNWTLSDNIYVETYDEPNDLIVDSICYEILELSETTMIYKFTVNYPD